MENIEKLYKIRYGTEKEDYINRYLKEEEIIDGYLSESKAFDLFFDNMILCNNYLQNNFDNIEPIIDAYNEENDEYIDEYQFFIVDLSFDEETTKKAVERMGNTLYYDDNLELYITGVSDFGTSRTIVATDIEVCEVTE